MQGVVPAATKRKMRIIALPLTTKTATRDALTYYHFITRAPAPAVQQSYVGKAQAKAASVWAGFGKAKGGWQLKVFTYGEKLYDRLEFEELALSGLDPALGPKLHKFGKKAIDVEKGTSTEKDSSSSSSDVVSAEKDTSPISLIHPKFYSSTSPVDHLNKLLEHRTPKHRKGFFTWGIIAPLTAPFAIVPVVPNLPFFFCVWRAWTHYKAYKASDYLLSLSKRSAIASEENDKLDAIYAEYGNKSGQSGNTTPSSDSVSSSPSTPESDAAQTEATPLLNTVRSTNVDSVYAPGEGPGASEVILTKEAVPKILELFELPESAAGDIYRAIEQARQRTNPAAAS